MSTSPSDDFLVLFDFSHSRQIICAGERIDFRVEIPWARRQDWFEMLREHLREVAHGANSVLGLDVGLEILDDTIIASGMAHFYLLAPAASV